MLRCHIILHTLAVKHAFSLFPSYSLRYLKMSHRSSGTISIPSSDTSNSFVSPGIQSMAISHMPHAWLIPPIRFTNQPDHTPNTLNLVFLLHCLFYSGLTFRRYEEKYMKLKVRETRELASILQCPHFSSIYSKLG